MQGMGKAGGGFLRRKTVKRGKPAPVQNVINVSIAGTP